MGITFKKSEKEVASLKKEEPAPEAKAEPKEAASKSKLAGTAKKTQAKGSITKSTVNNKTGEETIVAEEQVAVDAPTSTNTSVTVAPEQKPVVWYQFGFTHNLGDFNSSKCAVGLSMPLDDAGQLEEAYAFLKDWVDTKVMEVYAEVSAT